MKNKIISIILIVIILFTLTSCNGIKNDNATIQIWWYNDGYSEEIEDIIYRVQAYCDINSIPLEVVSFDVDILTYDDYILKRNVAMANGNMITIDDARNIQDIGKYHADYSRVENYDKLFDVYKNRFCIPIGLGYLTSAINNEVLEHYDISTDKNLITYDDYFNIKHQIREKGGKFKLNKVEYYEIIKSFMIKNGICFINEDSEIIKDAKKFKEAIKKTAKETYDYFKLYYSDYENIDFLFIDKMINDNFLNLWTMSKNDSVIYEEKLDLKLADYKDMNYLLTCYDIYENNCDDFLNKTFVIDDCIIDSPCVFMYKKITNDKIYDVFNYLIDESSYITMSDTNFHKYSPMQNTEKIREVLEVDDNWQYNGKYLESTDNEKYKKLVDLINESYEILIKDEEKSKIIASYYFYNRQYSLDVFECVSQIVSNMINNKIDYDTPEADELINEIINEFIANFNVHYN